MPNDTGPEANTDKVWTKPVIDDADVSTNTSNIFASGIDNYEASNPTNYGRSS